MQQDVPLESHDATSKCLTCYYFETKAPFLRARLRRRSCRRRRAREAAFITAPEVYLAFADRLAGLLPALFAFLLAFCGERRERGPVYGVVVFEVDFAAGGLHELGGGNVVGERLVVANFGLGDRVDEGGYELEEGRHVPGHWGKLAEGRGRWLRITKAVRLTMGDECPAQSFRIVVLQNAQDLSSRCNARLATCAAVSEIDQERQCLLPWGRNVQCSFQHVDEMFHLFRTVLRILLVWEEI